MQVPQEHPYLNLTETIDLDDFRGFVHEPRPEPANVSVRLLNSSPAITAIEGIIMGVMGASLPARWQPYDTAANLGEIYKKSFSTNPSDLVVATLSMPPNLKMVEIEDGEGTETIDIGQINGTYHIGPALGANRTKALEVASQYSIQRPPNKKAKAPTSRIFVRPKLATKVKVVENPFAKAIIEETPFKGLSTLPPKGGMAQAAGLRGSAALKNL